MKRFLCLVLIVLLSVALSSSAFGNYDYWNLWTGKPWQRGTWDSTYQGWEIAQMYSPGPYPTTSWNYYGVATMTYSSGTYPVSGSGPAGPSSLMLGLGDGQGGGSSLDLWIPNTANPQPVKMVYVQITADKAPAGGPFSFPASYQITSPGPLVTHSGTWATYNWLIEISPNPDSELIHFDFPDETNIYEVWIDTVCTVPEPASVLILGGGIAGLLGIRRRKA